MISSQSLTRLSLIPSLSNRLLSLSVEIEKSLARRETLSFTDLDGTRPLVETKACIQATLSLIESVLR
uniref:Uncharacterized protein n=1 Tax=Rhizophora mucronata TaxID=61149 RepID=A0A2P2LXE7_RHIMU